MTQSKIDCWHRSRKIVVKLQNYYTPTGLQYAIAEFVDYYNNEHYHESLDNLTPGDVCFGRTEDLLSSSMNNTTY